MCVFVQMWSDLKSGTDGITSTFGGSAGQIKVNAEDDRCNNQLLTDKELVTAKKQEKIQEKWTALQRIFGKRQILIK